jgi:CCR4-NOT transcription complex subunit 9
LEEINFISLISNTSGIPSSTSPTQQQQEQYLVLVADLLIPEKRENALLELSKKRENFPNLALTLWHSVGVIAVLLQELVNVYDLLSPPNLNGAKSNRVCNALALLQCVASHPETRPLFLNAHIPLFLYPFLNTVTKNKSYEYLRLTSLGVIGALVKSDDPEVLTFLLSTEIIPLCLRIMETGSELSKTVATFIVQKILYFDVGLNYICQTPDRFYAVSTVLANMVEEKPGSRLLKHIIRCYLRLSDHIRAREALRNCLPDKLRDDTFAEYIAADESMKRWLVTLLTTVGDIPITGPYNPGLFASGGSAAGAGSLNGF